MDPTTFDSIHQISGTLFLVVGSDEMPRIKIHTQVLKAAFQCSGRFSAEDGDEVKTKDILLPEDDPQALQIICQVLPFQGSASGEVLDVQDPLEVSIVADKYSLCQPLAPAAIE